MFLIVHERVGRDEQVEKRPLGNFNTGDTTLLGRKLTDTLTLNSVGITETVVLQRGGFLKLDFTIKTDTYSLFDVLLYTFKLFNVTLMHSSVWSVAEEANIGVETGE